MKNIQSFDEFLFESSSPTPAEKIKANKEKAKALYDKNHELSVKSKESDDVDKTLLMQKQMQYNTLQIELLKIANEIIYLKK